MTRPRRWRFAVGFHLVYDLGRGTLRLIAWLRVPAELAERWLRRLDVRPGWGRKKDLGGDKRGVNRRRPSK